MRYVVYYIAVGQGGGGETILDHYYQQALTDKANEWWFIVPLKKYAEVLDKKLHVVYVDVLRSNFICKYVRRKCFELFEIKKLIKKISPDEIISLQNMVAPVRNYRQTVYLHQSFQFSPVKFSIWKKRERSLAFRQKVICPIIRRRLSKADSVIVQTHWMKEAVSQWADYPKNRIVVETPIISIPVAEKTDKKKNNSFFYPANAYLNKNHCIIIEACKLLKQWGYYNYSVQFTISKDGNAYASQLYKMTQEDNLPIEFIGHIDKDLVYSKCFSEIMLFPSYIETFGLPLLEVKSLDGRVIVSSCPFSHEILDDYEGATFAEWNNPAEWANAMKRYIDDATER